MLQALGTQVWDAHSVEMSRLHSTMLWVPPTASSAPQPSPPFLRSWTQAQPRAAGLPCAPCPVSPQCHLHPGPAMLSAAWGEGAVGGGRLSSVSAGWAHQGCGGRAVPEGCPPAAPGGGLSPARHSTGGFCCMGSQWGQHCGPGVVLGCSGGALCSVCCLQHRPARPSAPHGGCLHLPAPWGCMAAAAQGPPAGVRRRTTAGAQPWGGPCSGRGVAA